MTILCGPSYIGQACANSAVLYELPTTIVMLLTLSNFRYCSILYCFVGFDTVLFCGFFCQMEGSVDEEDVF